MVLPAQRIKAGYAVRECEQSPRTLALQTGRVQPMTTDNSKDDDSGTDERFELSRRMILGGIGGGVGFGALLGSGATWTFLTDTETFANNEVVTGELDLAVAWQQTYNGDPVNAFPDEDGDGVQDPIHSRQEIANEAELPIDSPSVEKTFQNQFADVPDDVESPVINLDDVKPGDAGSISFDLHLFDNPGYVTMTGSLLESNENGINEPEGDRLDTGPPDEGELVDAIEMKVIEGDGEQRFEGPLRGLTFVLEACGIPTGPLQHSTTREIEVQWELPEAVGNRIQTDSASFDLSFVTEQLRHNENAQLLQTNPDLKISTIGCTTPAKGTHFPAEDETWCAFDCGVTVCNTSNQDVSVDVYPVVDGSREGPTKTKTIPDGGSETFDWGQKQNDRDHFVRVYDDDKFGDDRCITSSVEIVLERNDTDTVVERRTNTIRCCKDR